MELTPAEQEKLNKIHQLASHILKLATDSIVVNLRFFDMAIAALKPKSQDGMGTAATDGVTFYYDPIWLLKHYEAEPGYVIRLYLHTLMHCIFHHNYAYDKVASKEWDLAVDLAVENIILELELPQAQLAKDDLLKDRIRQLWDEMNGLGEKDRYTQGVTWDQTGAIAAKRKEKLPFTAEHIYKHLLQGQLEESRLQELRRLSQMDVHDTWIVNVETLPDANQFERISERIKADLKSFSKDKNNSESLMESIKEATKEHYDYGEILARFTSSNEDMSINDDEFDYIFYTYGLETYGNMPLVEPLEYKEIKKVKEFVIVIDTSASCHGEIVQRFLKKTYGLLKQSESFFKKVNIHIIQADSQITDDVKITCDEDFESFLSSGKLKGFGSTDFRPAFSYVNEQIQKGEFENLKGLIYFTDGYGTYPDDMPAYDTIFAFLEEDEMRPKVPDWALKVIMDETLERTDE